jgi:type II secretory pathway component GspD/PulD (secretin)
VYLDAVQDRVHRQAQIDARVIEVELNDEKSEGIDWSLLAGELAGRQTGQRPPRRALMGLRVTDVTRLLELLAAQGRVVTLASPRLLTLNNEPAIVSTDAMTLSVTPQIGSDAVVTLSLGPFVKDPMRAQSDMIARVGDGETLVISGFTRAQETRERKSVGVSGGGWFGRSTVVTHKHRELVILLTPRIVSGVMAQ